MDYVVGSVAALITGNVTPNRPRLMKRALTPTKHQPSPNVTPKSEFVEDRSIFLSPSVQKKKAIVKKSPKRIFQNPDLESTENSDGNLSITSPKADKVKKHLKDELEGDNVVKSMTNPKSPVNKLDNKRESVSIPESNKSVPEQDVNESTPKKKKKKHNSGSEITENVSAPPTGNVSMEDTTPTTKSPKKRKQRRKSVADTESNKENNSIEKVNEAITSSNDKSPAKQIKTVDVDKTKSNEITESATNNTPKKKNKRRKKKKPKLEVAVEDSEKTDGQSLETNKDIIQQEKQQIPKKKNKKRKKSKGQQNVPEIKETIEQTEDKMEVDDDTTSKSTVNPNAITDKESDSEHESDNEIESENEEINKKVLEEEKHDETSDEEEDEEPKKAKKKEVEKKDGDVVERSTEEEIKRTLFVGNVPFSVKCKKEIKKIFSKHGQIETIRIRTVPIKDGRYTPKLAVIKNELHPERTTVNVYIKYAEEESIEKALAENNTILNEHHLRVSRSSSTGVEHDPRCSVFIGNLPFAMEDEALRAKFENCGAIHSVRIIRDKKTNAGKGFGYVNFESKDGVELALALTEEDLTVKNRILRVKRCTQVTNKKKVAPARSNQNFQQKGGFKGGSNQGTQQSGNFRSVNNQMNHPRGGFAGSKNQGDRQRGGFAGGNHQGDRQRGGFTGDNNQGGQTRGGFASRKNQGDRQRGGFAGGNNQGPQQRGGFNKFANQRNQSQRDEEGREGAHRRVMNKRKSQDVAGGGDGPPNKKQKDISQPNKEKKSREEFVGMTAEKKKKRKFDKGQKKKKALSEILTK